MEQSIAVPDAAEPEWLTGAKQPEPTTHEQESCGFSSLQLLNPYTGELRNALRNRFRHCKRCAELARKAAYARLNTVAWNAFVSLPMPAELATPTLANIKRQSGSLKQFLAKLHKNRPVFKYAWVREISKTGRLHLHMLWTIPWVPHVDLQQLALDVGFGCGVDIQSLHTPGTSDQQAQITWYMTKNLAPIENDVEGAWPKRTRRCKLPASQRSTKRRPAMVAMGSEMTEYNGTPLIYIS
jgi:hypothetical protein